MKTDEVDCIEEKEQERIKEIKRLISEAIDKVDRNSRISLDALATYIKTRTKDIEIAEVTIRACRNIRVSDCDTCQTGCKQLASAEK